MTDKIFDCFTFFNEIELLELRFQETYHTVDYFVVCESELTFTGLKKPLYFKEHTERFRPYMDKVIHLVVNDVPDTLDPFDREHFQRKALVRGLGRAEPNDLIMISDVDELIRPQAMRQAQALNGYVMFDMAMYQFYFNLRERPSTWFAAYAFKRKDLHRIYDLSLARWDRSHIRTAFADPEEVHVVPDAGWHFTYLGGMERLQKKFASYSHSGDNWGRLMIRDGAINKHVVGGGVVGNLLDVGKIVPIDASFPRSIVERQDHFREIGFIKDPYEALSELQAEHRNLKRDLAIEFYHDPRPRPELYGLEPKVFAAMAGITPPIQSLIDAVKPGSGTLLSRGKSATQSSVSQWSVGASPEADASGALDGAKTGGFKFHTAVEHSPWWMVDLEDISVISEVHIYNRLLPEEAAARASRLKIEVAVDRDIWIEVYRKDDDAVLGGADGRPLIWTAGRPILGRFVRIALTIPQSLHLDQVEVFGSPAEGNATGGEPTFTSDWFSRNSEIWTNIFKSLGWDQNQSKTVVELGCFEGRASLWILENLLRNPASRLHCVDVFPEQDNPSSYGARHRRNIWTSPRGNMAVRHAQFSYDFMLDCVHRGEKADFIYIDASHRSAEVLEDLILAFQALNVGGVIICDDYLGGAPDRNSEGVLSTPKMAIDVFTTLFRDRLRVLPGVPLYQLAFVKTAGRDRDDPTSRWTW